MSILVILLVADNKFFVGVTIDIINGYSNILDLDIVVPNDEELTVEWVCDLDIKKIEAHTALIVICHYLKAFSFLIVYDCFDKGHIVERIHINFCCLLSLFWHVNIDDV